MLQLTFLFLGVIAAGATYVTLSTADDQKAIMFGLIGAINWALWAYSSLNVVVYDGSSNPLQHSDPALAALGVMLMIPNLFVALTGPLALIEDPSTMAEEVN